MNFNLKGMLPRRARLWSVMPKFALIMKLTTLLLIISIAHVSGKAFSQITLNQNNADLAVVLHSIESQSGYVFVYNESKIKLGKVVSIKLNNASIEDALKACFQNTDLTYRIVDRNIVLRKKQETLLNAWKSDSFKPVLVLGKVHDKSGNPISGASVLIKRTRKGVSTDRQGRYVMKEAEPSDTLIFSYLGYATQSYAVSRASNSILDVELQEATNQMDEMVVQGYGKTSRRLATGNIASVSGVELTKQPVMNPILALQGKVAGVIITPTSGNASGPVKIEIRGRKSLNSLFTSDPLYIIDGVPLTVLEVAGGAISTNGGLTAVSRGYDQSGLSGGQSPFFGINPNDIESIEILKDADATAIYGSRGANGVLLITTKKGAPGKTRADFSFNRGVNFTTRHFRMLNTEQYLSMRREAFDNAGVTPTVANAYDLLTFDQHRYTDWQDYFLGSNSQTDLQGSISGGAELTNYRIGVSFGNTNDMNTVSGKNQRGTFSLALHNQTSDGRLAVDLRASYAVTAMNAVTMPSIITLPPNAPDPLDEQGNLNYLAWGSAHSSYPFRDLKNTNDARGNALSSSLNVNYNVAKGLSATVMAGYGNTTNLNTVLRPIAGLDPFDPSLKTGESQFGTTRINNVIIEPQLNYHTLVSKGSLSLLAGATYQHNTTSGGILTGKNYTDDALLGTITNAPLKDADDHLARYKYAGIFARMNYSWDNRYILNLNVRRDGSSRFGNSSKFGNFYSIGAAWIATEESWAKKVLPDVISLVKFRGSYGITGSDGVGDYKYLTQYGNSSDQPDYNGISSLTPQIQPNSDYHWQVNRSYEAAMDLGFFKDRLMLNAALYRSLCDNQLVDFLTPDFTGFSSVVANSPAKVANEGVEFQLTASLVEGKNFNWSATFNTGFNRNKLLSYPNLEKSPYASQYKIGASVDNTYLLNYIGIDPLTGEYAFEDHNQDGNISTVGGSDSRGDMYIPVNTAPKFTANMNHIFSYKTFSLSANFYLKSQMGKSYLFSPQLGANTNMSYEQYINRWQKPGDQALTPRVTTGASVSRNFIDRSTQGWTDASFIRLQSLNLAGSLPEKFSKKLGFSNLSLSVSASNIFVLTKYNGLDPDVQNFGGTPPFRTVSFGLRCSL